MKRKKRILLVEDEAITALAETRELEKYDYDVQVVNTGEEAVEAAVPAAHIDIILMDINLGPGIDGTEAAKIILKRQDIPIIFLSSHTEPDVVDLTERITSYGYVVKQSGITVLDASIKMAFRLYQEKQQVTLHQEEINASNEELQAAIEEIEATSEELRATNEQLIESQEQLIEQDKKLSANEHRFRTLFESLIEGICLHEVIYDTSGTPIDYKILEANQRYEEILNLNREDVTNRLASDIYKAKDPPYLEIYARVADTGRPEKLETYFPPMKKHFTISIFSPEKGTFATVFEDITERRKTESQLRESEEKYRTYIENAPEGIFIAAPEGNYIEINEAACRMTGYSRDELLSMTIPDLISPEAPPDQYSSFDSLRKEGKVEAEILLRKKTGEDFYVMLSAVALSSSRFMAYCTDITEIKNLLKQKDLLMREVHHRIKNDMSTIRSLLSIQRDRSGSPEVREILAEAENRLTLMGNIYTTLYQKTDIDRIDIGEYLTDLIEMIKQSSSLLPEVAVETRIHPIHVSTRDSFPIGIIINELFTNALKYAFPEQQTGSITVSLQEKSPGTLELVVADTGIGITEEIIDTGEFGFGFLLIESMVKQCKGTLAISTNDGTTVTINLPVTH